jgi:hypothetical protein
MAPDQDLARLVASFNRAFNDQDIGALESLISDDFIHETGSPGPLGLTLRGKREPLQRWEELFKKLPSLSFATERQFGCDDHVVVQWLMTYEDGEGVKSRRGVDIFRASDGKLTEKLTYVKG